MSVVVSVVVSVGFAGSVGVTWQGERLPSSNVTLCIKGADCSREVTASEGWHTLLSRGSIPAGCTDYRYVEEEGLVKSEFEEDWRASGHTIVDYGFELTQDEDNQQGHLLCRFPFEASGSEIFAQLEYVMEPKSYDQGGGQGLCIYLLDPSVPDWDRKFDGSGQILC